MTPQEAFHQFCEKHGIEPNDERFVMFLGGLRSTLDQQPVAYGYFAKDGSLLQMTEFLDPGRVSKPIPLYARPITDAPMPEIHQSVLEQVWRSCYAPDDVIGFAKWVEKIARASR